jgi:hypothetical protein
MTERTRNWLQGQDSNLQTPAYEAGGLGRTFPPCLKDKARRAIEVRQPGASWHGESRALGRTNSCRVLLARRGAFVKIRPNDVTRKTSQAGDGRDAFSWHPVPLSNRSTGQAKAASKLGHRSNFAFDRIHSGLHAASISIGLRSMYSLTAHLSNADCRGMRSLACV